MEVIKKTILQQVTTGTTTGCTGTCRIIIPDTGATYNIKLLLTGEMYDFGFFDAYTGTGYTHSVVTPTSVVVTGNSQSRLSELRKYSVSPIFNNQYMTGGTYSVDGVDTINSYPPILIIYYLGGIRYTDITTGSTSGTTFWFIGQGLNSPDFINVPYFKDPRKEKIISNLKINNDVFITRQELSAFDKNYRLEYIRNLSDLETYAGGKFFNIINNT